jgi:hypothetical protein
MAWWCLINETREPRMRDGMKRDANANESEIEETNEREK